MISFIGNTSDLLKKFQGSGVGQSINEGLDLIPSSSSSSTIDRQDKIKSGINGVASVAKMFGPIGWAAGTAAQLLTKFNYGKKIDDYSISDELATSSSMGGLKASGDELSALSGKRAVGKKRRSANTDIANQLNLENKFLDNLDFNKQLQASIGTTASELELQKNLSRAGGFGGVQVGKKGAKLDVKRAKSVVKANKNRDTRLEDVAMMREGGKINKRKGEYNIIPGGKLHGRLHNIGDIDKNLGDQITKKGIPVVEFGALGEVTQHAEIEVGELTLRLKAVEKLEKLIEDGSDDALIKAGKLLTDEVMNKTINNAE